MKKAICLILCVLFACALTGCGKEQEPEEPIPTPVAVITMANGKKMTAELYPDKAPNTVANFVILANSGFYDGLSFHMVVPSYFILGGDPSGNGKGGPGYTIAAENSGVSHMRGTISMARRNDDPNSAGSQFFIMHGAHPDEYDGKYTAFGQLIGKESFDTLDGLACVVCDLTDKRPLNAAETTIESIRVDTKGYSYELEVYEEPKK